jgi:hypothetical protein
MRRRRRRRRRRRTGVAGVAGVQELQNLGVGHRLDSIALAQAMSNLETLRRSSGVAESKSGSPVGLDCTRVGNEQLGDLF